MSPYRWKLKVVLAAASLWTGMVGTGAYAQQRSWSVPPSPPVESAPAAPRGSTPAGAPMRQPVAPTWQPGAPTWQPGTPMPQPGVVMQQPAAPMAQPGWMPPATALPQAACATSTCAPQACCEEEESCLGKLNPFGWVRDQDDRLHCWLHNRRAEKDACCVPQTVGCPSAANQSCSHFAAKQGCQPACCEAQPNKSCWNWNPWKKADCHSDCCQKAADCESDSHSWFSFGKKDGCDSGCHQEACDGDSHSHSCFSFWKKDKCESDCHQPACDCEAGPRSWFSLWKKDGCSNGHGQCDHGHCDGCFLGGDKSSGWWSNGCDNGWCQHGHCRHGHGSYCDGNGCRFCLVGGSGHGDTCDDCDGDGLCDHCHHQCLYGHCLFGHHILSGQCAGMGIARVCGKLGYFTGCNQPIVGTYAMGYPLNPDYFDPRDWSVYAAQGYGTPVGVPLAPQVEHTYNYGWGIPASRLTPISRSPMGY